MECNFEEPRRKERGKQLAYSRSLAALIVRRRDPFRLHVRGGSVAEAPASFLLDELEFQVMPALISGDPLLFFAFVFTEKLINCTHGDLLETR